MAAVNKSPVRRSQIFDPVLTIAQRNAGVTPRHFRLRIVGIQIDVRKDPAVGVPAANIGLVVTQGELLTRGSAAFDYECGMHSTDGYAQRR